MKRILLSMFMLSGLMLFCSQQQKVYHVAKTRNFADYVPRSSDVIMRNIRPNPTYEGTTFNTIDILKTWHVTRLEWTYHMDADFIRKIKAMDIYAGSAINAAHASDAPGSRTWQKGRNMTIDGDLIYSPWMRWNKPHPHRGCANSQVFRDLWFEHVKTILDQNPDGLQVDDPSMNKSAYRWGGCFCPACMAAFPDYLKEHANADSLVELDIHNADEFNYKEFKLQGRESGYLERLFKQFQETSPGEFFIELRQRINTYAGRHVPMSYNEYIGDSTAYAQYFDYGFRELSIHDASPPRMRKHIKAADKVGKPQVFTMPLEHKQGSRTVNVDVPLVRKSIATAYAMGSFLNTPFDTYLNHYDGGALRYYPQADLYVDLYGFVRANKEYMNGYEDAAVAGNGFRETRYKNSLPMMFKNDSTGLYAFMRAKPGDPSAPIVIHVVNWSDQNTACKLLLLKSALFDDTIGEIKCYLPVAYNEVIHEQAKATSNYSLLRKEKIPRILNDSDYMTIEVPSLDIWGIIVIEKA